MAVILFFVLMTQAGPTSLSQEFDTSSACEAAKTTIREKVSSGQVLLLTCVPKG